MMKVAVLFLLLATFFKANCVPIDATNNNATVKFQGIQPANYVNLDGHFYYFSPPNTLITVAEAMDFCNFEGMKLISLETKEKNDMISAYMMSVGLNGQNYWTSGHRFQNRWLWTGTGTFFDYTYTSWYPNEPNDPSSGEVCVYFNSGLWIDYPCSFGWSFICE